MSILATLNALDPNLTPDEVVAKLRPREYGVQKGPMPLELSGKFVHILFDRVHRDDIREYGLTPAKTYAWASPGAGYRNVENAAVWSAEDAWRRTQYMSENKEANYRLLIVEKENTT